MRTPTGRSVEISGHKLALAPVIWRSQGETRTTIDLERAASDDLQALSALEGPSRAYTSEREHILARVLEQVGDSRKQTEADENLRRALQKTYDQLPAPTWTPHDLTVIIAAPAEMLRRIHGTEMEAGAEASIQVRLVEELPPDSLVLINSDLSGRSVLHVAPEHLEEQGRQIYERLRLSGLEAEDAKDICLSV